MPDGPLSVLLDWSEAVKSSDDTAAFGIERLRDVLPALVRAFVFSHTYARSERDGGNDAVDIFDAGCGSVVSRVLAFTRLIAAAMHGEEGRALVAASRAELAGALAHIHELMTGR
jgi:hypothetical protein